MILNRSHVPWAILVSLATAAATALFLANYYPETAPWLPALPPFFGPVPPIRRTFGGTPLGLILGSLSLAIFLFASALGIRKKRRLWRIGHVQSWLRAHIWLTLLTIPLVLFHCGFHFGGLMTTGLMLLYAIVMVSGLYGLAMQQFIPRLMTRSLPQEAVYEQIPHVRRLLVEAAEGLWKELAPPPKVDPAAAAIPAAPAAKTPAPAEPPDPAALAADEQSRQTVAAFLQEECFPYLRAPYGTKHHLGLAKFSEESFRTLKLHVTPKWQERVEQMQQWCTDRRHLDGQARLHHWLHWWLLFHVPCSFALLVVTFWHAYVTVIYL